MKQTQVLSRFYFWLAFTGFFVSIAGAQTTENIRLLRQKIKMADSVIIISHEVTAEYGTQPEPPDWETRDTTMNLKKWYELHPPKVYLNFLEHGKINRKIIIESKTLAQDQKVTLSNILLRQVLIKRLSKTNCDEPRHTIIIWKNSKQSYIDICFGCRRIHTSTDIDFSESYIDEMKWNELESFFKANGLIKLLDKE